MPRHGAFSTNRFRLDHAWRLVPPTRPDRHIPSSRRSPPPISSAPPRPRAPATPTRPDDLPTPGRIPDRDAAGRLTWRAISLEPVSGSAIGRCTTGRVPAERPSTFRRGSTRFSQPGMRQLASPASIISAGTSTERTISASSRTRAGQTHPEQFDDALAPEDEGGEYEHHDRCRSGDRRARRRQSVRDRLGVVAPAVPLLVDATDQKYLVVHREAEQDREHEHRHERLDRAGRAADQPFWNTAVTIPKAAPADSMFITAAVSGIRGCGRRPSRAGS